MNEKSITSKDARNLAAERKAAIQAESEQLEIFELSRADQENLAKLYASDAKARSTIEGLLAGARQKLENARKMLESLTDAERSEILHSLGLVTPGFGIPNAGKKTRRTRSPNVSADDKLAWKAALAVQLAKRPEGTEGWALKEAAHLAGVPEDKASQVAALLAEEGKAKSNGKKGLGSRWYGIPS